MRTPATPALGIRAEGIGIRHEKPSRGSTRRTGTTALPLRMKNAVMGLLGSGALRAAFVYGSAGVGFALANLLMARVMEPREYGIVALVIALFNVSVPAAPLGADGILLRRRVPLTPTLLSRVALTSLAVASVVLAVGVFYYRLSPIIGLLAFGGVVAGGVGSTAAAYFQSTKRLGLALLLSQGQNIVLLALVVFMMVAGIYRASITIAGMSAFYVVCAAVLWSLGMREDRDDVDLEAAAAPFPTREAISYAGVIGVSLGLVQAERLVLPGLLGLEALALFGVLAAIVGSVFRVLLLAVGLTLVPDLRRANTVPQRRAVMRGELRAVGLVVVVTTLALWALTPTVVHFFVGDKYVLAPSLIAASICAGWFKVASAFGRSAVTALSSARDLHRFNIAGWISVCISLIGAIAGAPWGLTGVVWGLASGWLALSLAAAHLAWPHFRETSGRTIPADDAGVETQPVPEALNL